MIDDRTPIASGFRVAQKSTLFPGRGLLHDAPLPDGRIMTVRPAPASFRVRFGLEYISELLRIVRGKTAHLNGGCSLTTPYKHSVLGTSMDP